MPDIDKLQSPPLRDAAISEQGGQSVDTMTQLRDLLRQFNTERDWRQFHTPENLAKSISIEAGELLECFQWSATEYKMDAVTEELADIMMYCIMFADAIGADPRQIMLSKLERNQRKYPVDKARGSSKKYTEFEG